MIKYFTYHWTPNSARRIHSTSTHAVYPRFEQTTKIHVRPLSRTTTRKSPPFVNTPSRVNTLARTRTVKYATLFSLQYDWPLTQHQNNNYDSAFPSLHTAQCSKGVTVISNFRSFCHLRIDRTKFVAFNIQYPGWWNTTPKLAEGIMLDLWRD